MIGVAIAVGLLFLLYQQETGTLTAPAGIAPPDGGAPPPPTTSGGIPLSEPGCGGIGGFIESHVQRKDAIAPLVVKKYTGLPSSVAGPIASIASKLDASGYVENAIDKAVGSKLCNVNPLSAAAAGAKFLGKEAVAGAKAVGSFVKGSVTNPLSTATGLGTKLTSGSTKIVGGVANLADRGTQALYSKLPAPLKLGAAPAVAVEKVTATAVKDAGALANRAATGLASGAKGAEHAVSSGVNKVLGWL